MFSTIPSRVALVVIQFAWIASPFFLIAQENDLFPDYLPSGATKVFLGAATNCTLQGAQIVKVIPNSPAHAAGMRLGDIIQDVDGFRVGIINGATYSLPSELRRSGSTISITYRRQQLPGLQRATIHLGGHARNKGNPAVMSRLGVTSEISEAGETIRSVTPDSYAEQAGLQVDDVITHVDGYRVTVSDGNIYSLASEIRHSPSGCNLTIRKNGGDPFPVSVKFAIRPIITRKVHAILVGLTDDSFLGPLIPMNLDSITTLLKGYSEEDTNKLPPDKIGSLIVLKGSDCQAQKILETIDTLQVSNNDAILFYYAGHGAYNPKANDPTDLSGGHFFEIYGGDLLRKSVWTALSRKNARLTVCITDTCNVPKIPIAAAPAAATILGEPPIVSLLLRYQGHLDINGSSRDESGWYTDIGGIFTASFVGNTRYSSGTWGDVIGKTRIGTQFMFSLLRTDWLQKTNIDEDLRNAFESQLTQYPQVFRMDLQHD